MLKTLVPSGYLIGFIDRLEEDQLVGWLLDRREPNEPVRLSMLVDGEVQETVICGERREDVAAFGVRAGVGFSWRIPASFQDGAPHVLTLRTEAGEPVSLPSRFGAAMPELHFRLRPPPPAPVPVPAPVTRVFGNVDGVADGIVQGWVVRLNEATGTYEGGVTVLISLGGHPIAEVVADRFRPDVNKALGADPSCGFMFSPPSELAPGKPITLRFHALPEQTELPNSPLTIELPSDASRARINALLDRVDELFRLAYHLRLDLKAALPQPRYFVPEYERWAAMALPLARARAVRRYGALNPEETLPLVSIICPIYRPQLADFRTAIESVTRQTYRNWELLLIDDGSGDEELSREIDKLAREDSRIRAFPFRRNRGISRATNKGLAEARGEFIAFFDHDDVLEPAALEIMVMAARRTGAKLLYSDEDKIDRAGHLTDVHLKPDFNYRLLLSLNYICHFVMVARDVALAAGEFDPRLDGAQDHDFLLRLTEHLRPGQIHHVAEVLYHWRRTTSSTATTETAKPYAAIAGKDAVTAHLKRRGLSATVTPRPEIIAYRIDWRFRKRPRVSIVIPFRDQPEMTRACVESLLATTRHVEYDVLLVDNWSQEPATHEFLAELADLRNVRVLRVAEKFNFSRLNNLAVAQIDAPFVLFLNNDVIVSDPDWLRIMLDEALADPAVGAVGAKLLYPDSKIQHAGVIAGVGGVGDHIHRGIPGDALGYFGRAVLSQDLSIVTAACLLCRTEAFRKVGGFDEEQLPVAFNDVDLCLKLRQAGYRVIWSADSVSEHRESLSRGDDIGEAKLARFMLENEVMKHRWRDVLANDPFFNPHFSRDGAIYNELSPRSVEMPGETG